MKYIWSGSSMWIIPSVSPWTVTSYVFVGLHSLDWSRRSLSSSRCSVWGLAKSHHQVAPNGAEPYPRQSLSGLVHKETVLRSGNHGHTSETLWTTSPVLINTSWCWQAPLEWGNVHVTVPHDPRLDLGYRINVAATLLRLVSNIFPLYPSYIPSCTHVQLYWHIRHLQSSVCLHAYTLHSIWQLSDRLWSRQDKNLNPTSKERHNQLNTNNLRFNITINHLLFLLRKLQ